MKQQRRLAQKKQAESAESPQQKKEQDMSERKKRFYAGFVKSSTLQDGVEEKDEEEVSEKEDESPLENLPTLDELHKLCGGANGSGAAALGIKMNGKLARVAEQERLFEEKLKAQKNNKHSSSEDKSEPTNMNGQNEQETSNIREKKKRKRKKIKNRNRS